MCHLQVKLFVSKLSIYRVTGQGYSQGVLEGGSKEAWGKGKQPPRILIAPIKLNLKKLSVILKFFTINF